MLQDPDGNTVLYPLDSNFPAQTMLLSMRPCSYALFPPYKWQSRGFESKEIQSSLLSGLVENFL